MSDKSKKPEKLLDFSKLTPRVSIEKAKFSKLYEKAFFKPQSRPESEYSQNTSTWD